MSHTKGPWAVGTNPIEVNSKFRKVATCFEFTVIESEENRSNATLIAAAPELKDACESMYSILSVLAAKQKQGWDIDLKTDLYELLERVDPVMKKVQCEIIKK